MSAELIAALAPLIAALVGALLGWVERKRAKPNTLRDANTPDSMVDRWRDWVADRLRNDPRDRH